MAACIHSHDGASDGRIAARGFAEVAIAIELSTVQQIRHQMRPTTGAHGEGVHDRARERLRVGIVHGHAVRRSPDRAARWA
jgi:hypothetical protein